MSSADPAASPTPRWLVLAALALVGAHVLLVLCTYPPDLFTGDVALASHDYHYLFSTAFEGRELLRGGSLWGYSPFYMAGYPFGLWNSFGRRGYEFAGAWLPLTLPHAVYLWVVATALLPPFVLALAARVLGWPRRRVLLVLVLAILLWHCDNTTAYFWGFGMVSFPFANALAVLFVAALVRAVRDGRIGWAIAAGALLAAVGWNHQLAVFPVAAGIAAVVVGWRRQVFGRGGLLMLLAFALALATLVPWLLTLLRYTDLRAADATPFLTSGIKHLVFDLLSDRGYGGPTDQRVVFHVLLVATVCALPLALRHGDRASAALGGTALLCLCFTYGFPYLPVVDASEPYRFVVAFALFAVLPSVLAFEAFVVHVRQANRSGRIALAALAVVALPAFTGIGLGLLRPDPASGLDAAQRDIVDWLRGEARRDGRVLCQDIRLGDLLPFAAGQAVIGGGVSAVCPLVHTFASASPDQVLQRAPAELTAGALAELLARYVIAHVVSVSPQLDALLGQLPDWRLVMHAGPARLWTYAGSLSYVRDTAIAGARVVALPNAIDVSDAPRGRFTLAFHWLDGLAAPDGVQLYPVAQPDDPVPFLGVDNAAGLPRIRIALR